MLNSWWGLREAGAHCGDTNNGFEFVKFLIARPL